MYRTLIFGLLTLLYQNGREFYQQALVQEQAAGNLEAAIQLYQDAARYAGDDRALAAQALLGAARCHEKLGQAKARELYEEIARTYTDQQQQATQARDRAAALQPHEMRAFVHIDESTRANMERESAIFKLKINDLVQVGPGVFWKGQPGVFDPSKPVVVKGAVTQVEWTNPSISVFVDVMDADGKHVTYTVKGGAPNTLFRNGFDPKTIRPGDIVTIEGLAAKDPNSLMIGVATATLADGRRIFLGQSVSGQ